MVAGGIRQRAASASLAGQRRPLGPRPVRVNVTFVAFIPVRLIGTRRPAGLVLTVIIGAVDEAGITAWKTRGTNLRDHLAGKDESSPIEQVEPGEMPSAPSTPRRRLSPPKPRRSKMSRPSVGSCPGVASRSTQGQSGKRAYSDIGSGPQASHTGDSGATCYRADCRAGRGDRPSSISRVCVTASRPVTCVPPRSHPGIDLNGIQSVTDLRRSTGPLSDSAQTPLGDRHSITE